MFLAILPYSRVYIPSEAAAETAKSDKPVESSTPFVNYRPNRYIYPKPVIPPYVGPYGNATDDAWAARC